MSQDTSTWPRWVSDRRYVRLREVRPNLYVGGEYAPQFPVAGEWRLIVDFAGTSYQRDRQSWYEGAQVLYAAFEDGRPFPPRLLDEVAQKVAFALGHGPVLFHCHAGLSRSASAAYAMLRLVDGLDHPSAMARVKVVPLFPRRATIGSARRWVEKLMDRRGPEGGAPQAAGSRAVLAVPPAVRSAARRLAKAWNDPAHWNGPRFTSPVPEAVRIGRGNTRVAWAIGDFVVKLPVSSEDGDAEFNRQEASVYRRAPAALRGLLLPVLAADPRGMWLIMPRAGRATSEQAKDLCRRALRAAPWIQSSDEMDCDEVSNAGVWNGEVYLLDYPVSLS